MMKIKLINIVLIINFLFFITNCSTAKQAFVNQKKNSLDEFLVEKKSPLVMPPDFGELPLPNNDAELDKTNVSEIKNLINENEKRTKVIDNSNKSFEENILEKIKQD